MVGIWRGNTRGVGQTWCMGVKRAQIASTEEGRGNPPWEHFFVGVAEKGAASPYRMYTVTTAEDELRGLNPNNQSTAPPRSCPPPRRVPAAPAPQRGSPVGKV